MKTKRRCLTLGVRALLLSVCSLTSSVSAALVNGDFSLGLEGWTKAAVPYAKLNNGEFRYWGPFYSPDHPYPHDYDVPPPDLSRIIAEIRSQQSFELYNTFGGYLNIFHNLQSERELTYFDEMGRNWIVLTDYLTFQLYQEVEMLAGQILTGWAKFGTSEYLPHDYDAAVVSINGTEVWENSLYDVYDFENAGIYDGGVGDWEQWQWVAPNDGTYRLELSVRGDDQQSSGGSFRNIQLLDPSPVPDSGSTGVMGTCALLVLAWAKRPRLRTRFPECGGAIPW